MSKKIFQILSAVYIVTILVVSTIPGGAMPDINLWSIDKLLHIIEYFILAFLAINAVKKISGKTVFAIIFLGIAYGGFNEIWQGVMANRYASLYDALANGVGMFLGSFITVKYLLFTHD